MKNIICGLEKSLKIIAIIILFSMVFISQAIPADFQVQPMTMDLGGNIKSGAFSVINNGKEKIDFQVSVKEWTQDEKGKDVYTDTNDIVFFPKVMSVDANSQRAIRIGFKAPLGLKEKTYRLFVEEIPTSKKAQDMDVKKNIKAGVTISFRFSMPIFVKPLQQKQVYVIDTIEMSQGTARTIVKNTGNVHIKLRAVKFSGKAADGRELYSKEVAGWYILNGLSVPYEAAVPKDICGQLASMEVSAQTETVKIDGKMNVEKNMCTQ